jgi:ribosomal protein L37E
MSTALRDRLRRAIPKGDLLDESMSYPTLVAPTCRNRGPRPTWLLSKWHCPQDHDLERRYGLRCEDYWRLFDLQGGVCALCGFPPRRWRLVIHHWHDTGEVPCLLHFPCNRIIDPLVWLLPRLVAILTDPPGRRLGLVVPKAKLVRLEADHRAKRTRTKAKRATPVPPSNLDKLRAMTRKGA